MTIVEASGRIRRGELGPADLLEQCLGRIDKYEDRVRAWVVVDEEGARRSARRRQEEAASGEYRGPLHGIPLGIKDIIDVEGLPTRAGSPLREDHVARSDAPLVAALRRAGAVVLGKTVTCQFACFDPSPTRNPWDPNLGHSAGGSSSGSAAAVASRMCLGSIGSQTGGSLVRPASYCGAAACKPTFGRISTEGVVPVSHHLDHPGPMARTAGDLHRMLAALIDSWDAAAGPLQTAPRLGLVEEYFMEEADEPIREATDAAIRKLADGGAEIEPVRLPAGFGEVHASHRRIMVVEAAAVHRRQFAAHRDAYARIISAMLKEGMATSAVDYAEALAHQREYRRRIGSIFEGLDALVMPATDTTAPARLDTTGDAKFQSPWSYAGLPVMSIPCGLASDGFPAAIQLVARNHEEEPLVRVAQWCEERLEFSELPPLVG
jgi:aspartyl-tRNA(Asn)/glutamyl-tRNA(Gln) amidotransferase subunit A